MEENDNLDIQPHQAKTSSESVEGSSEPKKNPIAGLLKFKLKIIVGLIILTLIILLTGTYFLLSNRQRLDDSKQDLSATPTIPYGKFQTIELMPLDLNDSNSVVIFSDANKIYKISLDGSDAQEVSEFQHNISFVDVMQDGTLFVQTDNSRYKKFDKKKFDDPDVVLESGGIISWTLSNNSKNAQKLDSNESQLFLELKSDGYPSERIYTKELPNGQAEILLDKLDGTTPTKIGTLSTRLVAPGCYSKICPKTKHPGEFFPSFDGSYLLSKPPGGGGLGESAVVITRDGSKAFEIDFYWYVSSAVWIGNDRLLTRSQDGKQTVFSFKPDGTFAVSDIGVDVDGDYGQQYLSPSKKYLYVSSRTGGNSLYDLINDNLVVIDSNTGSGYRNYFLGWNKNSDKLLYAKMNEGSPNPDLHNEIKVFDIETNKTNTIARLNPIPSNYNAFTPNIPISSMSHFAIY